MTIEDETKSEPVEEHWAIRRFKEKMADFERRHPGPPKRTEFDDEGRIVAESQRGRER